MGIDTNSGFLRIVDNGFQTFTGKNDFLKNSASMKPKSVAGKLLGKMLLILHLSPQPQPQKKPYDEVSGAAQFT